MFSGIISSFKRLLGFNDPPERQEERQEEPAQRPISRSFSTLTLPSLVESEFSPKRIVINCHNDVEANSDDPIYSLILQSRIKCKVEKCSTIYIAAVQPTSSTVLHAGLVLENTFYVTEDGQTKQYSYLVAHALYQDKTYWKTKLIILFCNKLDTCFEQLKVFDNEDSYNTCISKGWDSVTSCSKLVQHLKCELRKPFDDKWGSRIKSNDKVGNDKTNCVLFAARIYYTLAPENNKRSTARAGLYTIFKELNLERVFQAYINDFE